MRVLIVDDEAPARRKLRRYVAELSDWTVAGEARSVRTALDAVVSLQPDLLLLDIQLGDGSGFEVVRALPAKQRPRIIFVTAFDQHAVEAFEVHAVDYLLKPVDRQRFSQCVQRLAQGDDLARVQQQIETLMAQVATRSFASRIYVEQGERGRFLPAAQIIRLTADRNYVKIHTAEGAFRTRGPLAAVTARLDPDLFVRVSRSALVNLDHVTEVQSWFRGDRMLILSDGTSLRLSRLFLKRSPVLAALLDSD